MFEHGACMRYIIIIAILPMKNMAYLNKAEIFAEA
jgi:hypothetical protein